MEDIVRGFEIGGVDYITKPFNIEEVLSRIKTHLKIERLIKDKESLNKKLQDQNDELIASENQYRIILEKSSDGVFRFDAEGKILTSNSMFHSPLGFEAEGIVGRPIMKIINSEDSSSIYPKIATRRCGDRATSNLKIQFCINENFRNGSILPCCWMHTASGICPTINYMKKEQRKSFWGQSVW